LVYGSKTSWFSYTHFPAAGKLFQYGELNAMTFPTLRHRDLPWQRFVPWTLGAVILAGGCAPKPSVVGTWIGQEALPSDDGKAAGTVTSQLDLRADGTFHKKGASETEYNGTYTVKDDTLTETFTSYTTEGQTMAIPASAPNVDKDTFTLKGNTLTLTPEGGGTPSVLTRQGTK
jgi:hypothetical protein